MSEKYYWLALSPTVIHADLTLPDNDDDLVLPPKRTIRSYEVEVQGVDEEEAKEEALRYLVLIGHLTESDANLIRERGANNWWIRKRT